MPRANINDDEKQDLYTILTFCVDVEDKTPKQFRRIIQRILKDQKTKDAIENYVAKKLKPFGVVVTSPTIDHRDIDRA